MVFRIFILGIIIVIYAIFLYYYNITARLDDLILAVSFVIPSIGMSLYFILPELKSMPNKMNKTGNTQMTEEFDDEMENEELNVQLDDDITEESEGIPVKKPTLKVDDIKMELSAIYDKKIETIGEKVNNIQFSVQEIQTKGKKLDQELFEFKKTFHDMKRQGKLKIENLESTVVDIMTFRAQIENPFNYIHNYFQLLKFPEIFHKEIPKDILKQLKDLRDIEAEDIPEEKVEVE
jgi:hypothetical protein